MTRTNMMRTLSVLALGAAVLAGPALARGDNGHGGPRAMPSFEQLDTNGDGSLTMDEFEAPAKERFAAADTNGDGALSAEELDAARPQGRHMRGDGPRFGRMMPGMRGGDRAEMTPEMRQERATQMIEHLDDNGDGLLSAEELAAGPNPDRIFAKMDADGNGAISKAEFDAAKAKFAEMGPHGAMMRPQN